MTGVKACEDAHVHSRYPFAAGALGHSIMRDPQQLGLSPRSQVPDVVEEKGANCCYAVSDKAWATDPQGVRWETFRTTGDLTVYGVGETRTRSAAASTTNCCPTPVAIEPVKTEACCGGNS